MQEQQVNANGEAPAGEDTKRLEAAGQGDVSAAQSAEQRSAAETHAAEAPDSGVAVSETVEPAANSPAESDAGKSDTSGVAESNADTPVENSAEAKPAEAPAGGTTEANKAETSASSGVKAESSSPEAVSGESGAAEGEKPKRLDPAEREARRAAALAAKAAAKAAAEGGGDGGEAAEPKPKEPSPNQPLLDKITALIREQVAPDAVEDQYINEADSHLPVVVVKNEHWLKTAKLLKQSLQLDYLINLSGVDYESYMEVVYHIESFQTGERYCLKVRTDREAPSIASVAPVWSTANWPEREVYDLLGIQFPGHPDLRRILMPDDWVGHPLRKDYVPLDPEV